MYKNPDSTLRHFATNSLRNLLAQASVGKLYLPMDEIYSIPGYPCMRISILKNNYVFPQEAHSDVTRIGHPMEAKKLSILIINTFYSLRTL